MPGPSLAQALPAKVSAEDSSVRTSWPQLGWGVGVASRNQDLARPLVNSARDSLEPVLSWGTAKGQLG